MPVQYKTVPYSQLLCHQGAYDLINYAGAEKIPNWDMDEFERTVLGMGSTGFFCNPTEYNMVFEELSSLDKSMPFLKFGEKGQHYAYELFLSPPENWGSRGAPFFWAYTARQFTYDKLPMEEDVCGHRYVPTYRTVAMAPHMGRTRYMRCPQCEKKSWQKKVLSKD